MKPFLIATALCLGCGLLLAEGPADEKVAEFLNQHFVSIKLDREERPDVDAVYMKSFQAMTRALAWSVDKPSRLVLAGEKEGKEPFLKVAWQVAGGGHAGDGE